MRRQVAALLLALLAAPLAAQPVRPSIRPELFATDLATIFELPPRIEGPVDPRFFGTYCQPAPKEFCKSVPILPDPCKTLRDMKVRLRHLTTRSGGLLQGDGNFVFDGKRGALVLAGAVLGRNLSIAGITLPGSHARFVATVPGMGEELGRAVLSANGLQLTAFVQGRTVVLRKDACGNNPPVVGLTAPFGPTFPYGQSVMLGGQISDEDTSFPEERQVFLSNRQGVLAGSRVAGGRTLFTSALVPGPHLITFFVTDSGGLTGQASLDLTVINRPPETPRIFLPAAGATLSAGAPVLLSGNALDPDSGFLSGAALLWSAQLAPGGPFAPLGSGNEVGTSFAAPADPLRLRLTAADSTGQTAFAERVVRVVAGNTNAPPVAVIRQPDRLRVNGSPVAGFFSFQPASFVGSAFDVEDPPSDLEIRWELVAITSVGGAPLVSPPVPNPAPITGTLAPVVSFHPNANLFYRVTLTVTDQGGATSSDSIEIYTLSNPIL